MLFKDWGRSCMCSSDAYLPDPDTYPSLVNIDIVRGVQKYSDSGAYNDRNYSVTIEGGRRSKSRWQQAQSLRGGVSQEEPIHASLWLQMALGIPWLVAASHRPHLHLPVTFTRSLSVCVYFLPRCVRLVGDSEEEWTPTGSVPCWLASVPERVGAPSC